MDGGGDWRRNGGGGNPYRGDGNSGSRGRGQLQSSRRGTIRTNNDIRGNRSGNNVVGSVFVSAQDFPNLVEAQANSTNDGERGNRQNHRGQRGNGNRRPGNRGNPRSHHERRGERATDNRAGSEPCSDDDQGGVPRAFYKKREKKFEGPVFGFKRLYKFLDTNPDQVLLSINKDKSDWKLLLESEELTGEKLIVAIHVIGEKLCVDEPVLLELQTNALTACCSKEFTRKLEEALPKISSGNFLQRRNPNTEFPVDSSPLKVMNSIYQLCNFLVKTMPNSAVDFYHTLICTAMGASLACDPTMGVFNKFKMINEQIKEFLDRQQKKQDVINNRKYVFNDEDLEEFDSEPPPESIKEIEVIPTIDELRLTSEPFLRPNKQKGAYNDADHYLDVQFRLLREDFVQPLRKGIRTFLKDRHEYITRKKRMPLGEIRLYTEVRIEQVVKERDSVVYKLKLSEANYKRIKWEKSKRLLTGSLIVLTTGDNCFHPGSTHFGVVFSRIIKEMEKGVITVAWEGTPPAYNEDEEYLMFESEVYLEAYRHTLETMKKLDLTNFPMKKFIVDACSSVEAPQYLKNATELLKFKLVDEDTVYISPQQLQWPSAAQFGLDENQLEAFRAAITKEFTIIQGPPGTGKTFLGLKVAEVLLNNGNLWGNEDGKRNPITVVCYTNHALDQFLEGILKYYQREEKTPDIIRIGGRCKSENLAKYSLWQVRNRNRKKLPGVYWAAEREAKESIYELEEQRASRMSEVTGLQDLQGVVDFEKLSGWSMLQPEFPKLMWNLFQKLDWFGIGDNQMKIEKLSEDKVNRTIREWFQVRNFPKVTQRKKPEKTAANKVERNPILDEEGEVEEEDFDIDELLEHRLVDDILLEAGTSSQINMGRHIAYLPESSFGNCEKSLRSLNRSLVEAKKSGNQAYATQFRDRKKGDQLILENRMKFLAEIFRLYREQLLDLPDVSDLLVEIREGGAVLNHFQRLPMCTRWALYFAVAERMRHRIAEKVAETEKELTKAQKQLRNIIQWGDGMILQDCQVVGLTTTGAAKYNNLLQMMKSKIVIVEEAAEVFEAHIVTCITEHCQQLILIGDHRQLRPSPTVYNLATKYHLDLSLFERMLNNKLHCYQLKMQHRMRPDISDLITGPIYEELHNHDSVKVYPDVKGIAKNIFFLTHIEKESSETDSTSKSNMHEAKFLAALCRHLVLQGYNSEQITVLTMYTGQMFLLKKEIGATGTCKGVRVTCVDNFQGEENDIILLSLVRSNSEGNIGFLKIDNRICVALSRARHGLYVIGNMEAMVEKSKTWRAIVEKLEVQDAIGEAMYLQCQIHGTLTLVKSSETFISQAPEGGCSLLCDTVLPCTHKCTMVCHIIDREHEKYKCRKPCLKLCGNDEHPCRGACFEPCPPCMVRVEKILTCELRHTRVLPCHKSVEGIVCTEQVERTLPCGHKETLACHIDIHEFVCKVSVRKNLQCGHPKMMECHVNPTTKRCFVKVMKDLPCKHKQQEECWMKPDDVRCVTIVTKKFERCGHELEIKCHEKNLRMICKGNCKFRLSCGHACIKICHLDDDPEHNLYECKKNCSRECRDGHKCILQHPCCKPCPPCKQEIKRNLPCGHEAVLACHTDINQYECLQECERIMQCGHKCRNLCFQPCGPCQTIVKKRAPCTHMQEVPCQDPALKQNCEVAVRPNKTPACGHCNTLVACKYDSYEISAEELAEHCQSPCGHTFSPIDGKGCEHKCKGTCSKCWQGRIHMKCQSKCGRQLVCGHVCEVPCSAVCPPCQKPCMMKCEHSECKMKCGEPCSDCQEPCGWICLHKKCTKKCGEVCDREPCNEPCPEKLKCSHDCVGFCGEPCPPLCRVCDAEELTSFFLLGNETDEDSRFIYLEECGHTIEVEGLEGWINVSGDGDEQISAKCCPRCKTTMRNCRRFGNVIKQHYKDVMAVKKRAFGNKANTERMQNGWVVKLNNSPKMERVFGLLHENIKSKLVKQVEIRVQNRTMGMRQIPQTLDEFSMQSLDFIADSADKVAEKLFELQRTEKLARPQYEEVVRVYRTMFASMLKRHPLSRQEVMDFNEELDRLDYFQQLMMRRSLPNCNPHYTAPYGKYKMAKDIMTSNLPFTYVRREQFKRLVKELDDLLRSGLGISDRERRLILSAMGQGQGHWFKCPNGHIYVITECGGAMQESKCNECGARIGGGSHRLRDDNRLATEMDGARQSAFPGTGMMPGMM